MSNPYAPREYDVALCNLLTGERRTHRTLSEGPVAAREDALTFAFKQWRWRKTLASDVDPVRILPLGI